MGGAGSLALLISLTSSQMRRDLGPDYAQFRQAYESYIDALVRGDHEKVATFISPKFVWMSNEDMVGRIDYLERIKNNFLSRQKMESGEGVFKSVVPEMSGYTVTAARHLTSTPVTLESGPARMHQKVETKESWVFKDNHWQMNTARLIGRRAYWRLADGTEQDLQPRRG